MGIAGSCCHRNPCWQSSAIGDVLALNTELGWSWISFNKFLNLLFAFTEFIRWGRVRFAFYFHLYQSLLNISSLRMDNWSNDWHKLNANFQQSQGNFFLMPKLILKVFCGIFFSSYCDTQNILSLTGDRKQRTQPHVDLPTALKFWRCTVCSHGLSLHDLLLDKERVCILWPQFLHDWNISNLKLTYQVTTNFPCIYRICFSIYLKGNT